MFRSLIISLIIAAAIADDPSCGKEQDRENPESFRGSGNWDPLLLRVPFQLSLTYRGKHICGATLYNPKTALTAAHCIKSIPNIQVSELQVRGGNVYPECQGVMSSNLTGVCPHNSFSLATNDYDIAVLHLETEILSDPGTTGEVSGWGFLDDRSHPIHRLHAENVTKISHSNCAKKHKERLTPRMTCYTHIRPGCKGEFGGPLVVGGQLEGIASWGALGLCGNANNPTVYTRISHPEIQQHINECTASNF